MMTDEHLRKSIRAIATLQYVIAALMLVGAILGLFLLTPARQLSIKHAGVLLVIGVAVFLFLVARSLRKFRPWARRATIIISFIGLLGFPLGTLIYGPFLYVLIKGKHLFADYVNVTEPSLPMAA